MKYYAKNHGGSQRAQRILFRIGFVLIAAAVITFASILVGQHLLRKVAQAQTPSDTLFGMGYLAQNGEEDAVLSLPSAPAVFGTGVDWIGTEKDTADETAPEEDGSAEEGPGERQNPYAALAETFDAALFDLCDSDGNLVYQSPAVCSVVRIPVTETESANRVATSIAEARGAGLRVIASLNAADASTDAPLLAELCSYGVDDVLLRFDGTDTLDYETANRIRLYLITCSSTPGVTCDLGLAVSAETFLDPQSAMQIQMLASSASYLGIRFPIGDARASADVYDAAVSSIRSLLGSFSVYNLRVVIDGMDRSVVSAQYQACVNSGITNLLFTGPVRSGDLIYIDTRAVQPESREAASNRASDSDGAVNPYASTSASYEAGEEEAAGSSAVLDDGYADDSDYSAEAGELAPESEGTRPWY